MWWSSSRRQDPWCRHRPGLPSGHPIRPGGAHPLRMRSARYVRSVPAGRSTRPELQGGHASSNHIPGRGGRPRQRIDLSVVHRSATRRLSIHARVGLQSLSRRRTPSCLPPETGPRGPGTNRKGCHLAWPCSTAATIERRLARQPLGRPSLRRAGMRSALVGHPVQLRSSSTTSCSGGTTP